MLRQKFFIALAVAFSAIEICFRTGQPGSLYTSMSTGLLNLMSVKSPAKLNQHPGQADWTSFSIQNSVKRIALADFLNISTRQLIPKMEHCYQS